MQITSRICSKYLIINSLYKVTWKYLKVWFKFYKLQHKSLIFPWFLIICRIKCQLKSPFSQIRNKKSVGHRLSNIKFNLRIW